MVIEETGRAPTRVGTVAKPQSPYQDGFRDLSTCVEEDRKHWGMLPAPRLTKRPMSFVCPSHAGLQDSNVLLEMLERSMTISC